MNLYSRARRHIDMNRVKELREDKVRKNKIAQEVKEQIREELRNFNSPEFSNWRFDLGEGMTSSGTFFTTLPATGDVTLQLIDTGNDDSFGTEDTVDLGDFASNVKMVKGTGSEFNGAFGSGSFLKFSVPFPQDSDATGTPNRTPDYFSATTNIFTATTNTITFQAIAGNSTAGTSLGTGTNGGTQPWKDVNVYWLQYDDNDTLIDAGVLGTIPKTTHSLTNFEFSLPDSLAGKRIAINFYNDSNLGSGGLTSHSHLRGMSLPNFHPISTINSTGLAYHVWHAIHWDMLPASSYYSEGGGTSKAYWGLALWNQLQDDYTGTNWSEGGNGYPAPVSGTTTYAELTSADYDYVINAVLASPLINQRGKSPITYGIGNLSLKRKTPMNLFVSLDSPEATSFIRDSPFLSNLSPKEKLQKLKEMLEAGDEYLAKMFGENFPGTGLDPNVGEAGDVPGVELTDITSDAVDPGMGMGDQAIAPAAAALLANPIGQAALAAGAVAVASLLGITLQKAQEIIQQVNAMGGGYTSDPYGQDQAGPTTTGEKLPGVKDLTPQQQAEVEAAGKELSDAQRALNDLPADATDAQRDMAQERLDRASKRRQSLRKRHREENKNRRESFESNGEVLIEKKKLKSPSAVMNKIPGYYDGKPSPLGFPMEPPPKMVNGYHPDLVDGKKVAQRFNRLDPISAKAMPPTGNSHIDKKVRAAAKKPK